MTGDALSCRIVFAYVVFVLKNAEALSVELKSTALICQNRFKLLDAYLNVTMVGSSEYLCSAGCRLCSHSTEFLVCVGNRICRFVLILSQIMKMNISTLANEMVEPIDDTFHVV
jgi:hypothetical protein